MSNVRVGHNDDEVLFIYEGDKVHVQLALDPFEAEQIAEDIHSSVWFVTEGDVWPDRDGERYDHSDREPEDTGTAGDLIDEVLGDDE